MKIINTNLAPAAIGPYSQGIITGNLLYTSGQLPLDPISMMIVEGGIIEQTKQVFQNIIAIINEAGCSLNNIVKTTVFLSDMNNFAIVNKIYAEYFQDHAPARICVQVARLPKDALVEIEVICEV